MRIDHETVIIAKILFDTRSQLLARLSKIDQESSSNSASSLVIKRLDLAIEVLETATPISISAKRRAMLGESSRRLARLSRANPDGLADHQLQEIINESEELVDAILPVIGLSDALGIKGLEKTVEILQSNQASRFGEIAERISVIDRSESQRQTTLQRAKSQLEELSRRVESSLEKSQERAVLNIEELEKRTDAAISSVRQTLAEQSELLKMMEADRSTAFGEALNNFRNSATEALHQHRDAAKQAGEDIVQLRSRIDQDFRAAADSSIKMMNEKADKATKSTMERIKELEEPLKKSIAEAEDTINALEKMRKDAAKISNYIASQSLAGDYNKKAKMALFFGIFWQVVALASGIAFVYFAYSSYTLGAVGIQWPELAARGLVALSLIAVGALSIRQAERDYARHSRNERLGLELACLDPYLATLDSADRIEVKKKLAERFFGSSNELGNRAEALPASVLELARVVIEAATAKSEK